MNNSVNIINKKICSSDKSKIKNKMQDCNSKLAKLQENVLYKGFVKNEYKTDKGLFIALLQPISMLHIYEKNKIIIAFLPNWWYNKHRYVWHSTAHISGTM
jgi:hypothetical protein